MTRLNVVLLLAVLASAIYLVHTQYESRWPTPPAKGPRSAGSCGPHAPHWRVVAAPQRRQHALRFAGAWGRVLPWGGTAAKHRAHSGTPVRSATRMMALRERGLDSTSAALGLMRSSAMSFMACGAANGARRS